MDKATTQKLFDAILKARSAKIRAWAMEKVQPDERTQALRTGCLLGYQEALEALANAEADAAGVA
jgi:hypothetical protein